MKKTLSHYILAFPAGGKLTIIFILSLLLFISQNIFLLSFFSACAVILFFLAGIKCRIIASKLLFPFILALLLLIFQIYASNFSLALLSSLRLFALLSFAALLTATTTSSALLTTLERALAYLSPLGVNARKTALALSLCLRFLPLIKQSWSDARAAHIARGMDEKYNLRNLGTIFSLMLTQLVILNEDIAQAIDARAFDED